MRGLDTKKISTYFKKNNFKIVNDPKYADYIIFMTCAFLNTTTMSSLKKIKELKKYKAELILAGCLPDIHGDKLKEVFNGKTIPTINIDKIDSIFKENKTKFNTIHDEHYVWQNFNPFGVSSSPIKLYNKSIIIKKFHKIFQRYILEKLMGNIYPFFYLYSAKNRRFQNPSIYQLTISRGCIHNCSYCVINKAVGHLKSKPISQCVKEFKEGLVKGHKQFHLLADDIGPYGVDIKKNLPELLDELTKIEGDYEISLRNTHPAWIIKYLDNIVTILKRGKIKGILISIQCGSNRILKLMRRSYTKDAVIDAAIQINKAEPDLKLGTELIIGFPSETREEFKETLELFDRINIDNGMIASFSPVEGTDASTIEPKISKREIRKRMKIILKYLRKSNYFAWYNKDYCKGIFFKKKDNIIHK